MRALAFALLLITAIARADEPPPKVAWSFAAGLATAVVPLAVGGGIVAGASKEDVASLRAGVHVIAVGLALAPWVSHLIAREWKRAAAFGVVPIAMMVVAIGVFEGQDLAIDGGNYGWRILFGGAIALELIATGIGLADSLAAGERWRARNKVTFAPFAGPHGGGLALGGVF